MEQYTQADGQHPSVASACVYTHKHTDTRQKETKENWLEASLKGPPPGQHKIGVVVYTCHPRTGEEEAGEFYKLEFSLVYLFCIVDSKPARAKK